jgi:hypothetical protein
MVRTAFKSVALRARPNKGSQTIGQGALGSNCLFGLSKRIYINLKLIERRAVPEFSPFVSARLKLERARKHIADIDAEISNLLSDKFTSISIAHDAAIGGDYIQIETKGLPPSIGLMAGDAVNNLRSALDHMVSQMVFEKTGTRPGHVKYPIYPTRQDLEGSVVNNPKAKVKLAGDKFMDYLTNDAMPYKGGNESYLALNDLANMDKHEIIVPHVGVTGAPLIRLGDNMGNVQEVAVTVEAGQTKVLVNPSPGRRLQILAPNPPQLVFNVFFEQGWPGMGKPLVGTLDYLSGRVLLAIETCEAL